MGRLFLKLYSIIAIASIVFFLGVANLETLLLDTREGHATNLSKGTYYLMEQEVAATPKAQWSKLLARVNQGGGYPVEILPLDSLGFSASNIRKLDQGEVVLSNVYEAVYSFKKIINSQFVLQIPFEQSGYQHEQRLINSTFNLIEESLQKYPDDEWVSKLENLNQKFTFPLVLVGQDEVKGLNDELQRFNAGEVVYTEQADDSQLVYRKIVESAYALRLGPFEDSATLENLQAILMLVFSTLVALAVFLWVYPLSRDIKQLDSSTHAFGQGDFSVRASDSKRSVLFRLATSFNAMADRIQSLISSHKDLTNAVSHELRTPIARLRFGMEMLQDSKREEDRERFMVSMNSDIDELDQLVAELLTYARFDRDRPKLEFKRQEVSPWLDSVVRQASVGKSNLTMNFELADRELKYAQFDPLLMARALGNLLQNAARYASIQVKVTFSTEGENFQLIVDDDGPGIPEAERDSIFDAFKRLDSSRDRGSGGYGLGLSIAYRISEWHDGEISVSDSPLGGARFVVCWPQEKTAQTSSS